jgi:hypothetical protein
MYTLIINTPAWISFEALTVLLVMLEDNSNSVCGFQQQRLSRNDNNRQTSAFYYRFKPYRLMRQQQQQQQQPERLNRR